MVTYQSVRWKAPHIRSKEALAHAKMKVEASRIYWGGRLDRSHRSVLTLQTGDPTPGITKCEGS